MLHLEIGSPKLDLMKSIVYARRGVGIVGTHIGKFGGDFDEFDTFEMQEFNETTLLQFHRSGTFESFMIYISGPPAIFSRGNPKLSRHISIASGH
jgi:hypothetical protein